MRDHQHHAIRKAITDSYYDVRNEGGTMEDAADRAAAAVVAALGTTYPTPADQEDTDE